MMKLYYGPGACSFVPHAALEVIKAATGTDFETQSVKLHKGEQAAPEYLSINPNGQVPTLILADGPTGVKGVLHRWKLGEAKPVQTIEAHADNVLSLTISKDGKQFFAPTADNTSNKKYPIARGLQMYVNGNAGEKAQKFIDFVAKELQPYIEKNYNKPIKSAKNKNSHYMYCFSIHISPHVIYLLFNYVN